MRLWSLHPKHLDPKGLVALWREALLAQAVLAGKTKGYKHHPQLARFLCTASPLSHIAAYLEQVHTEATARGYHFDGTKIGSIDKVELIEVTQGQLDYEWQHLRNKLKRTPNWPIAKSVALHPLFQIIPGGIADWEKPLPS